jgi:hypothetical protein
MYQVENNKRLTTLRVSRGVVTLLIMAGAQFARGVSWYRIVSTKIYRILCYILNRKPNCIVSTTSVIQRTGLTSSTVNFPSAASGSVESAASVIASFLCCSWTIWPLASTFTMRKYEEKVGKNERGENGEVINGG